MKRSNYLSVKHTVVGFNDFRNDYGWRKLRIIYLLSAAFIIAASTVLILVLNSRESCETSTSTRTEYGYYKSGPQNWNNSEYTYKVPETNTTCFTASEQDRGVSLGIIWALVALAVVGYLLLPKLYVYLNPPKERKD